MRKALAVLLLLVLAAGGFFVYRYAWLFQTPYPEKLFPENTTFYISLANTKEASKRLDKTLLWQQIQKSPHKNVYQDQLARGFSAFESVTGVDPRPLFHEFQRDLGFGVFPVQSGIGAGFTAYIDDEKDVRKFLEQQVDPSLKRRIPDVKKSQAEYKGITYYKYNSSRFPRGRVPCYANADHHLIFAFSEDALRSLVDVKAGSTRALQGNELLKAAKKEIGYRRGLIFFVDVQGVLNLVRTATQGMTAHYWSPLVRITGLDAAESFCYNMRVEGEGFAENGFFSAKPQRQGLLKIYLAQSPKELSALKVIPADARVASAGTLADFAKMWDEVNAQLSAILPPDQYDKWQKVLNGMRGIFNFDIRRDVLEPIGNEFSFSYEASGPDPSQMKYFLVLQLRNPEKFRETLDRLVALAALRGISKREDNYHGKKIQTFNFSLGAFTAAPAYYFEGSWLYFATDPALLKRAVDTQAGGKNIQTLADYKKVTDDFPDKVNTLSYTNVQTYFQMYASILNRQAEDPQNRWISEYAVQQELVNLSQNLFGAASYSQVRDNGVYFSSYSSVPTTFLSLPAVISALPKILQRYNERKQ